MTDEAAVDEVIAIEFTTITANGEPLQHFQVPDLEHMYMNLDENQLYVLGPLPPNSYWDGSQWVEKSPAPSPTHVWDFVKKVWGPDINAQWLAMRNIRDELITQSDWMVTRAAETGVPVPAPWQKYRQALRDITKQGNPWAIVWPDAPNS